MDIDSRIERRRRRESGHLLIRDYGALSPVAHVEEPSDRGPVFEQLLDHLEPVFDGQLPPNAYVGGPPGSGKSAVVSVLFDHLSRVSTEARSVIHTSTRAASPATPEFVYLDLRERDREFAFYHRVLDALIDESVPEQGVSTTNIRSRLHSVLGETRVGVVVAVDHVSDPGAAPVSDLVDLLSGLPSNVSWLAIGRKDPDEVALSTYTATAIEIEPYRRQMLVDVLMTRASAGLARGALTHDLARRIADWAGGNAHDALAALFVAAIRANRAERNRLSEADVDGAIEEVPRPSVPLGRVLALPANKRSVLRELVDLSPEDRETVTATTEAISSTAGIDLSKGTVKRFLYEMAQDDVIMRVEADADGGKGRPPSRIALRFPPTAFRRLDDMDGSLQGRTRARRGGTRVRR